MPLLSAPQDIGRLLDAGPYRAWVFKTGFVAIQGRGGWNCWAGEGGATLLLSREHAETIICHHGHEPMPALIEAADA
jgi:hypothetical protein